jgi:hypothetical protein
MSSKPSSKLANSIFGKSEVQNRIALNAVKMIVGDIVTLHDEFKKADGAGALFFNPSAPEASAYMTIADIKKDIALAEEIMDDELKLFLQKLLNVVDKEHKSEVAIVVLINREAMSIHLIELNAAEERLNEFSNAIIRD